MKQYLNLLQDILESGKERNDRTGIGTISVFGRQIRFDLSKGFPAVTTKTLMWKSVVSELLWMLEGSTSEHRLAEIKNDGKPYAELTEKERKTIWTLNAENQGKALGYVGNNLGRLYSAQWRNIFGIDYSQYEIVDNEKFIDNYEEPKFERLKPNFDNSDEFIGKIYKSHTNKDVQIISKSDYTDNSGHTQYYLIQFLETNSTKISRIDAIIDGRIVDDYEIKFSNIGKMGKISKLDKQQPIYKTLFKRWCQMLERCYDQNCKIFKQYGGKGVKVCKRWHTFANYLEDICQVYNFEKLLEDRTYQIDKDMFGSKVYSKDTCIFMPKYFNQRLINSKPLEYNGEIYLNIEDFCEKNEWASVSGLRHHLGGKYTEKYKDIHYIEIPEGKHIRYKFKRIDQISNVIEQIKNDPASRRIMLNAWNVSDLPMMSLPPCHYGFQFYVDGDKLSLMWNQRSVDMACGLPFDIASYALLLHIVAKMTNKIPGELIGSLGDCHIYKNHIDGVKEQIKRIPHKLPTLKMPDLDFQNMTIDDILRSVKTSDFTLENYEHDPKIVYPMAV